MVEYGGKNGTNNQQEPQFGAPPTSEWPSPPDIRGRHLLRHKICEPIGGAGGFGQVYRAKNKLGKDRAIKVLKPELMRQSDALARHEALITNRVEGPHIVTVEDYEENVDGLALIIMEYVPGGSLGDLLETARGPLPSLRLCLMILSQVLEALALAHSRKVIHCDVKPHNILLGGGPAAELLADPNRDPEVKLADFGVARLVGQKNPGGKRFGTPGYLAPETEVTPTVDIYSAGAVAYRMLAGELQSEAPPAPLLRRLELGKHSTQPIEEPLSTSTRDAINALVHSMLLRNPVGRPDAEAALDEVSQILQHLHREKIMSSKKLKQLHKAAGAFIDGKYRAARSTLDDLESEET